jgi:FMN-dependent oxidoreductase (nitrilotriacetate monooxygenase family)
MEDMQMTGSKRKLKLAAFWYPPGAHSAGWRMPGAAKATEITFAHYVRVAQLAEAGKMDTLFFQDSAAMGRTDLLVRGDPNAGRFTGVARLEPMSLLPALATVTSNIGLVATGTTTYNEPYHLARRFATLDHISGGRAGWNLVTSQAEDEAQNFGFDKHMDHAERYQKASEFYDVVTGLWDSWDEDGVIEDKETGMYFDASKVHVLNHVGQYFKVRGPLNVARSPQGRPVIAQAGSSEPGMELAARTAECVFTAQTTLQAGQAFYQDLKGRMAKYGRNPNDLKILPGFVPVVGRTEAEAKEHYLELQSRISDQQAIQAISRLAGGLDLSKFPIEGPLPDLPPSNAAQARQKMLIDLARSENLSIREVGRRFAEGQGHRIAWGSPEMLADTMQEWVEKEACDGFCILFPYFPRGIEDFVNLVIPELQRRGIFRTEYEGKTLRENLGISFPVSRYVRGHAMAAV